MPTARMKPVKQEVNKAGTARQTNIFTIQAGRILEISVDTGTVKEALNLCKAGYFMGIQSEDHALTMLNSQLAQPRISSSVSTALTAKKQLVPHVPKGNMLQWSPSESGLQIPISKKYDQKGQGCGMYFKLQGSCRRTPKTRVQYTVPYIVGGAGAGAVIVGDESDKVLMFMLMTLHYGAHCAYQQTGSGGYGPRHTCGDAGKTVSSLLSIDPSTSVVTEFEVTGVELVSKPHCRGNTAAGSPGVTDATWTMEAMATGNGDEVILFLGVVQRMQGWSYEILPHNKGYKGFSSTNIFYASTAGASCKKGMKCPLAFSKLHSVKEGGVLSMTGRLSSTPGAPSLYFATWKFDTQGFHTSDGKRVQQESTLAVLTVKSGPPNDGWKLLGAPSLPAMKKLLKSSSSEYVHQVQRLLGSNGG